MISSIRGTLIKRLPPFIVVEVGGIGYELQVPLNNFYFLPAIGNEVTLFTHFVVREDTQLLFGFANEEQRSFFRALLKVNGIGAKTALVILSEIELDVFAHCILTGDINTLTNLPGIGKKTAERLIIEMRDSEVFKKDIVAGENVSLASREAVSALIALGYKPQDANRIIGKHKNKNLPTEELIRVALKEK
jgi:holliday junction DNA helicase RuvA